MKTILFPYPVPVHLAAKTAVEHAKAIHDDGYITTIKTRIKRMTETSKPPQNLLDRIVRNTAFAFSDAHLRELVEREIVTSLGRNANRFDRK